MRLFYATPVTMGPPPKAFRNRNYFDHTGKRQSRSARTTDKTAAERIAAKFEADAALRREGWSTQNSMRSVSSRVAPSNPI